MRQEPGVTSAIAGRAQRQAKALAIRKAKQAVARQAVGKTTTVGKGGTVLLKRLSTAVAAGVKALAAALWPVLGVAVLILVAAAAAVLGSPFGILFANENDTPDTIPISTAVGQLNTEFSNYLTALQAPGYDSVEIHGTMADWAEVLAVFAVKTAAEMADTSVFTPDQRQLLEELLTNYRALLAGLAADLTIPGGDAAPPAECGFPTASIARGIWIGVSAMRAYPALDTGIWKPTSLKPPGRTHNPAI